MLQPVRGTRDILPDEFLRHRQVVDTARRLAERFGCREMATPIFEFTEVFRRTLGETSDVVTKEMYTFQDRGGEEITLRPEYTAGIARAVISGGLQQLLPLKVFCHGPMFRYERPQKGRQRQFHQIDVEFLGLAEPLADVEAIALAAEILGTLGVLDKTVLELNTLGDAESRLAYRAALVEFLSGHRDRLSEDSRVRLERNPLRVLDSKDEGDRRVVADAPSIHDYLTPAAGQFFAAVRRGLDDLGVAYRVSPRLVRGLDYYMHTAFEFTTTHLGAQDAVIAGGRYDGLIETMGGPATAGIGWAGGIERLALLLAEAPQPPRPIALIALGEAAERRALVLAQELRRAGFVAELPYRGNMSRRMRRAAKVNAAAAVLLGDDELAKGVATVRDLDSGTQTEISLTDLAGRLAHYR